MRGSERERRRRNLINRVAVHFNSIRFDYYLIIRPAVTIVFWIPCLGIYIGGMSFAAATDTGQHDCRQLVILVHYRHKDGLHALQHVWRRAPLVIITTIHLLGSRSGPVVTCVILFVSVFSVGWLARPTTMARPFAKLPTTWCTTARVRFGIRRTTCCISLTFPAIGFTDCVKISWITFS